MIPKQAGGQGFISAHSLSCSPLLSEKPQQRMLGVVSHTVQAAEKQRAMDGAPMLLHSLLPIFIVQDPVMVPPTVSGPPHVR